MPRLNPYLFFCALAVLASLQSACSTGGDDGIVGTGFSGGPGTGTVEVKGTAQKGPYLKGSEVLVSALSATGVPSPDTTLSEIQDDMGTFVFQVAQAGPVLIAADGYHFNEITGSLSQGRLLLRAVYNATVDAQQNAYVNVLTHLTYKRTLTLLAQGVPVIDAMRQAETEVLQALRTVFPISDVTDFTQLSIYNTDTSHAIGNAYVLALSATVYQAAMLRQTQTPASSVDAQLTAILNTLSDDIADDASVADAAMLSELVTASHKVRPDQVRANLEARSLAIVLETLPVADLDLFIDSDGDGAVNAQDGDDDNDGVVDTVDDSPYVYSEAPVLVPTAATTGIASNTPFTLQWTTSEFASQIEVQIAKDADFSDITTSAITASNDHTAALPPGVYFLRSRAQSSLGGWGPWSVTTSILVDTFARAYFTPDSIDSPEAFIQTSDEGFLITGCARSISPSQSFGSVDGFVEKLSSRGDVQWRVTIPVPGDECAFDPFEIPTGDFLVRVGRVDPALNRVVSKFFHVGASGTLGWSQEIVAGANGNHGAFYVADAEGILVGASVYLPDIIIDGVTRYDVVPALTKFDFDGNVLWSYQLDDTQNSYGNLTGLWANGDGSYTITGNTNTALPPNDLRIPHHLFIANLSADRAELSVTEAPGDLYASGRVAQRTSDGGYALLGGGRDVDFETYAHLFKIGPVNELEFNGFVSTGCPFWFDCKIQANDLFVVGETIILGGTVTDNDVADDPLPLSLVQMDAKTGLVLARHSYVATAIGDDSLRTTLHAVTPTRDGGVGLLGRISDLSGTVGGFVVIKTDPAKTAPTELTFESNFAP